MATTKNRLLRQARRWSALESRISDKPWPYLRNLCLLCICAASLWAQTHTPGPQVLTFLSDVDDSDQPYALYLPKDFSPAKKYPLVISLHGAGSNHRLNLKRVFGKGNLPGESDPEATRYFPAFREVNYIVASPYARGTMGYQGIAEKDVYDVLSDVKKRFPIDEDRVYLTGLSMGGGGTIWLGLTRPDIWAAIAPVCPAIPNEAEELALNALNMPVHLFHGDQDTAVSVDVSRKWHKLLLGLGTKAQYVEYPGVRHNSWDKAYKDGAIFDWFDNFRRNRYPDRVRFGTRWYRYNAAFWVRIDGLVPGALASVDAHFKAKNRVEVLTSGVDGLTLSLEGHPKISQAQPLRFEIDGSKFTVKFQNSISFVKAGKTWRAGTYKFADGEKRPGLEGPISEATTSRHVYVYGTADNPTEDELDSRRKVALSAAEWSTPRSKLLLNFQVVADKDVSGKDLDQSNLILFGNKNSNSLIARFGLGMPLELNPGAADYGLVFVAPAGNRYVVINSGLPWWTGAEDSKRAGFRFLPAAFRVLLSFPDFVLFKGSLENVVAEGTFDRTWKVSAAEAAKLRDTGTIVIR